jgi:PAB-dependent poly(A)-specific ribonuclease subunit 3
MNSFVPRRESAAIPIVAPSASSPKPSPQKSTPSKTLKCRNIKQYGFCKYQDTCIFDHSPDEDTAPDSPTQSTLQRAVSPVELKVDAPVFIPKAPKLDSTTFIPKVSAPTFVPRQFPSLNDSATDDVFTDPSTSTSPEAELAVDPMGVDQVAPVEGIDTSDLAQAFNDAMDIYDTQQVPATSTEPAYTNGHHLESAYYEQPIPRETLNYHLYTVLPYVNPRNPSAQLSGKPASHRFFISDTLRTDLQRRSEALHAISAHQNLPEEVHVYHSLVPLETVDWKDKRKWFGGWPSSVYKAINRLDGRTYCLRRLEGYRLVQEAAFAPVEEWNKIHNPHIAYLKESFTTRAFGDHSLVFVYHYYPTAQTLHAAHLTAKPSHNRRGVGGYQQYVDEKTIWSYVIQIANAMKEIHDRGLAIRTLDASKVLVTGKNRLRINCCGIFDVLSYDSRHNNIEGYQQEDLIAFGKLVFSLCCHNASMNNLPKALEALSNAYSADLNKVAMFLISKPGPQKVINQLLDMFGTRLLTEMNEARTYADELEGELMGELENARLVRLLCKFGFINERPEFNHDPRWSETGDRYLIGLFRDYVFHQVDEFGNPVVNLTHVLTCLNKLDAGVEERILLQSRDEQSCLVVSYKDIKACIEAAFADLSRGNRR